MGRHGARDPGPNRSRADEVGRIEGDDGRTGMAADGEAGDLVGDEPAGHGIEGRGVPARDDEDGNRAGGHAGQR
jgi:hypothetical protein